MTVPMWSSGAVEPVGSLLVALTVNTVIEDGPNVAGPVAVTRWGEVTLADATPGVLRALRRMVLGPMSPENLVGRDVRDLEILDTVLGRLRGSVVQALGRPDTGLPVLSAVPVVPEPTFRPLPVDSRCALRLSRFASMRPSGEGMLVESPLSDYSVVLADPGVASLVARLAVPATLDDLRRADVQRDVVPVAEVVGILVAAGVVMVGDRASRFEEDEDEILRRWSPHELAFAVGTQRVDPALGGPDADFRAAPAVPAAPRGPTWPLRRPVSAEAVGPDLVPLGDLLETDLECPSFSEEPLSTDALGELLFRSARVRSIDPWPLGRNPAVQATQRPYISVARLYELEIYLALDRVRGAPRGLYHYEPYEHSLTMLDDTSSSVAEVSASAGVAAAQRATPAATVLVTARRQRVQWVLGGGSHAMGLIHAGALLQTLRLCAATIGLSLHPIPIEVVAGWGPVLDSRWPAEVVVGQAVLDPGPKPDEGR